MKRTIKLKLILFCFIGSALVMMAPMPKASAVAQTQDYFFFNPVSITDVNYEVRDGVNSNLLYTYNGSSSPEINFDHGQFADGNYRRYPGVMVATSEPFLVDYFGNKINTTDGLSDVNGLEGVRYSSNGTLSFLYAMTLGVDVAVRTVYNAEPVVKPYYVDDLVGVTYQGTGTQSIEGWNAYGVLYVDVNLPTYMNTEKDVGWLVTGAYYNQALFPNAATLSVTVNGASQSLSKTQLLSSYFGNSKVKVSPNLTIDASKMLLEYDYDIGMSNGGKLDMNPLGTELGLFNIRQSTKHSAGLTIDQEVNFEINLDETTQTDRTDLNWPGDMEEEEGDATVYFRNTENYEATLPFNNYVFPATYLTKNITRQTLKENSIDGLDLPTSAHATSTVTLQPCTVVKYADFESKSFYNFHYIVLQGSKGYQSNNHIGVPYGVTIKDTYAIYRVLIDMVALSNQDVLYINPAGEEMRIEDLSTFGLNEFGLTPNNVGITAIVRDVTIGDQLGDLFGGLYKDFITYLPWVLVAIVVVCVVVAAIYLGKPGSLGGGGGGSGGGSNSPSFWHRLFFPQDFKKGEYARKAKKS